MILSVKLEAELEGFEPSNAGVKVLCLTAWRQPIIVHLLAANAPKQMYRLRTGQLRANGGIQTRDLLITNQLLYQLSYISDEEKFITNLERCQEDS